MFPDAKVVTITQVVDTQVAVNRLMTRLSYLFFGILLVVGVASIAGTMFANVTERRREIGTLMALGATPSLISRLFLGKALVIGLAGGLLGTSAARCWPWARDRIGRASRCGRCRRWRSLSLVLAATGGARGQLSAGAAGGAHWIRVFASVRCNACFS